ncbi:M48 family metalloprotease [Nonomuraea polychroma]|uniref:M48 family metalloprotease n=1 Tax=Nonomuraea polychroma TaxID=46176 RepID=UPI003D8A62B7
MALVSALGTDLARFLAGRRADGQCGLVVSAGIAGRLVYGIGGELVAAGQERRRHLALLEMAARRDVELGALVLEHNVAAAYCLPGGGGRIVLTTSTLAALDDRRLAAVLAHERAHLRGRHHLLMAVARVLRR